VAGALSAHHRERSAGEVHDPIEVGVDLGAEILFGRLLEWRDMAEAGVVKRARPIDRIPWLRSARPSERLARALEPLEAAQ
jgi:hypothetical protein